MAGDFPARGVQTTARERVTPPTPGMGGYPLACDSGARHSLPGRMNCRLKLPGLGNLHEVAAPRAVPAIPRRNSSLCANRSISMQKLYCYVDESGQDTKGRMFIVAIVIFDGDKDALLSYCEKLEQDSEKGKFKWGKAEHRRRSEYLRRVFADKRFENTLRYAVSYETTDYDRITIKAIAETIHRHERSQSYSAFVYVDGLGKTKQREYSRGLRGLGIRVRKVRGIAKDENNALTRLADAIAGFVRDVLEGESDELRLLYLEALRRGMMIEVELETPPQKTPPLRGG